jgi:alginate O-acetyltransferase complex protein AlgI
MLFNSAQFLVFFIVVTLAYYSLGLKGRQWLLLLASCYFYAVFKPIYILILFFTIIIDYAAGIYIEQTTGSKRKTLLIISLVSNIGVLAFFKYFNFINLNVSYLYKTLGGNNPIPYLDILLPIGLSFHTFQAMSYTIEVYRGKQPAERSFLVYALYVMFYPQLVAGPIERPQNILPQLNTYQKYQWQHLQAGLLQILWGLFKKVVVADRLALLIDPVFANTYQQGTANVWVAVCLYSVQIFCDFSGYSDIALGTARCMGYELMANFRNPYQATTVAEFWRRWHLSLSTWFRDYLYFPLGGNKKGLKIQILATILVFAVSGLWHGASHNYLIWGLLHALFLIVALLRDTYWPSLAKSLHSSSFRIFWNQLLTFGLVSVAWVFFRNKSFSGAMFMLKAMFLGNNFTNNFTQYYHTAEWFLIGLLLVLLFWKERHYPTLSINNKYIFWPIFIVAAMLVYILGVFNEQQFIYFQF